MCQGVSLAVELIVDCCGCVGQELLQLGASVIGAVSDAPPARRPYHMGWTCVTVKCDGRCLPCTGYHAALARLRSECEAAAQREGHRLDMKLVEEATGGVS